MEIVGVFKDGARKILCDWQIEKHYRITEFSLLNGIKKLRTKIFA